MFLKPKVNSGLVAAASITILRELIGDDNGRVGVLTAGGLHKHTAKAALNFAVYCKQLIAS